MNANTSLTPSFRLLCISVVAILVSLPALPLRAAENQPPVVNITSPKGGDLFPTGVQVLIMATVQDLDGSVDQVEFFANGVSLGTVLQPVYALGLEWTVGAPGAYTLTARATDNSGATASSSEVNVQVTADAFVMIEATDPNAAEGNSVDVAKFTVRRWGSTTESLPVFYQVSGTATAGSDYETLPGTVTIPAGQTTAELVITPLNDAQVEDPETVIVELLAGSGYQLGAPLTAQATIADNKTGNAAPTVVMVGPAEGAKFSAPADILLKARAEDSDGTVRDVVFFVGKTFLGPGVADPSDAKLFTRPWNGVSAGSYAVAAVATDNDGATRRSTSVAIEVVTLPVVTISVADGTAREGTPATDTASVVVSRTGPTTANLVVDYQISGTATFGTDYSALSGTVEIPAGQASASILVVPIDDQLVEGSETVVVTLKAPTVGQGEQPPFVIGSPGQAEVSILDDDSPTPLPVVTVAATDSVAVEPSPDGAVDTATFTFRRTGATDQDLTVAYRVSGTAQNGIDYETLPGGITIPAGRETALLVVRPLADQLTEDAETVIIELVEPECANGGGVEPPPPGCYEVGDLHGATARILDWTVTGNQSPRVELVKPFSSQVFQFPAEIKMVAAASDSDGHVTKVEFWADGAKVGEQSAGASTGDERDVEPKAFTYTWTGAQPGRHLLKAVAVDNADARTESTEVPTLVITGDLPPLVRVFATDSHAAEHKGHGKKAKPDTATFKVERTGKLDEPLTVYCTMKGTAENGKDYLHLPGTVTIPAKKHDVQVVVVPVDDDESEGTESVILSLDPPPAGLSSDLYRLDSRNQAAAVIYDDDKSKHKHGPISKDLFLVAMPGDNGKAYRVEASDDLIHWSIVTDTLAESDQVEFVQTDMGQFKRRFYRVHPIVTEALDSDE